MASKKPIQAIVGHVGVEVSSLSASKKFYKTLLEGLGFKVIMDSEDGTGFSNQNFQVWVAEYLSWQKVVSVSGNSASPWLQIRDSPYAHAIIACA